MNADFQRRPFQGLVPMQAAIHAALNPHFLDRLPHLRPRLAKSRADLAQTAIDFLANLGRRSGRRFGGGDLQKKANDEAGKQQFGHGLAPYSAIQLATHAEKALGARNVP